MYTVIATLKVKEGKMDEAIQVLKEDIPKMIEERTGVPDIYPAHGEGRGKQLNNSDIREIRRQGCVQVTFGEPDDIHGQALCTP